MLRHVRLVPMTYAAWLVPDFVMSQTTCALFLSLQYHMLHPNYLLSRLGQCQKMYKTRVVLLLVDTNGSSKAARYQRKSSSPQSQRAIEDITTSCLKQSWVLICCFSPEECARYLETFKSYEKKSATLIKAKIKDDDVGAQLAASVGQIRAINKKDIRNLMGTFGVRSIGCFVFCLCLSHSLIHSRTNTHTHTHTIHNGATCNTHSRLRR
jgi:DNA excision repair protein ERCC-1